MASSWRHGPQRPSRSGGTSRLPGPSLRQRYWPGHPRSTARSRRRHDARHLVAAATQRAGPRASRPGPSPEPSAGSACVPPGLAVTSCFARLGPLPAVVVASAASARDRSRVPPPARCAHDSAARHCPCSGGHRGHGAIDGETPTPSARGSAARESLRTRSGPRRAARPYDAPPPEHDGSAPARSDSALARYRLEPVHLSVRTRPHEVPAHPPAPARSDSALARSG